MLVRQFLSFGLVGILGFIVDAGSFFIANSFIDNPYICRLISYFFAVASTWSVNRFFTFKKSFKGESLADLLVEWVRFFFSQGVGFFVNYGTFSLLVFSFIFFESYPILAIAVGSIAGLTVNFLMAKIFIFRELRDDNRR